MSHIAERLVNTNYNYHGIHLNNIPMLLSKKVPCNFSIEMRAIRAFTSYNYFIQLLYRLIGFKLIKINDYKLELHYKKNNFEFSKLSDLYTSNNKLENLKNKIILLNYQKRKGKCHFQSLCLLPICGDYLVTGYVNDSSNKVRVIHSWIETENNVIDYCSNLVISKENYYQLMNPEILSVIKKEDYLKDANSKFLNSLIGCKFYCLFRDELYYNGLFNFNNEDSIQKRLK